METVADLTAQAAEIARKLQEAKIADLEAMAKQAAKNARTQRDAVEDLNRQFHAQEDLFNRAHRAFTECQSSIETLDHDLRAEEFPSDMEIAAYEATRSRLVEERKRALSNRDIAERELARLKMETLKADQLYVRLAYAARATRDHLENVREEARKVRR